MVELQNDLVVAASAKKSRILSPFTTQQCIILQTWSLVLQRNWFNQYHYTHIHKEKVFSKVPLKKDKHFI
jgi:hypothetical protein